VNVDQERLARENRYVLDAVQALLGLIGPTVEAVALEVVDDDEMVLRFWVHGNEAEDAEDAVADMEGLMDPGKTLTSRSRSSLAAPSPVFPDGQAG
jgi:hypothetical protein